MLGRNAVAIGDVRELAGRLAPGSVQTIITSPPYFALRSYLDNGHADKGKELGSEATPAEYVANLVAVFRALRPALKDAGTIWLNLGDSYNGGGGYAPDAPSNANGNRRNGGRSREFSSASRKGQGGYPEKCLLGIPWRVAFALVDDGWILRSDCIWAKPAPMPESVTDRPTRSHEYLFLLAKSPRYFYDQEAIKEPYEMSSWTARSDAAGATLRGQLGQRSGTKGAARAEGAADGQRSGRTAMLNAYANGGRNKRSVWTVNAAQFPDAHYATFPEALIRPCVLAGTSERGECARCGTAWGRVVEVEYARTQKARGRAKYHGQDTGDETATWLGGLPDVARRAIDKGWAPQCSCPPGTPTRPQVVLDPFMGSGTTAAVAHALGRDWQGFDLDERALKWTRDRLAKMPIGTLFNVAD